MEERFKEMDEIERESSFIQDELLDLQCILEEMEAEAGEFVMKVW